MSDYVLYHHGIKGMKWGVRRTKAQLGYKSTGIKSAIARRKNEKVDKGFQDWKENAKKRDNAIEIGKRANAAKLAYEKDKSNKQAKSDYKTSQKEYKKALRSNTTYRKGAVRGEVGKDLSRKYLSEAKRVKKQLDADPSNKQLQKKYNDLMSKHDVERAKARKAPSVGERRSRYKASIKRSMTMAAKTAVTSAAIAGGAYAVNRYLSTHKVTLNGKPVTLGAQNIADVVNVANSVKKVMEFMW